MVDPHRTFILQNYLGAGFQQELEQPKEQDKVQEQEQELPSFLFEHHLGGDLLHGNRIKDRRRSRSTGSFCHDNEK